MRCCRMQRADQRFDRATAFIVHGLAHREHLFDATAPDLRGCERHMADTAIDRDRIPRLEDAYALRWEKVCVGKECVSTGKYGVTPDNYKKKIRRGNKYQ